MASSSILIFAFISVAAFIPASKSQDLVYSLPTQQSTVERSQLSSSNGDVFVGAGGTLYRLSSELQLLQSVPIPDSPSVLGLTTTIDGDYLVACFTNRRCAVYNTTTLNTVNITIHFAEKENADIALFTASLSGMPTLFIGFSSSDKFQLLQQGFSAGGSLTVSYESESNTAVTRQMYGGFVYGSNAYFLALDTEEGTTTMYIIRVCNDGQLAARYELQLTCGGTTLSSSSVITGVSEVNGTLVESVDGRVCSYNLTTIDTILDNFFTSCLTGNYSINNNPQFGTSASCTTFISVRVNHYYMYIIQGIILPQVNPSMCLFMSTNTLVLNPQSLSAGSVLMSEGVNTSLAISVEENLFLFVATANSVDKVSVTIIYHQYIGCSSSQHLVTAGSSGTTLLYSMPVSSPVTALSWSSAVDYVYATVGNQVRLIYSHTTHSS